MLDLHRKVIFTHPPKCAGTTIEGFFGWHPNQNSADPSYLNFFRRWKHASLEAHLAEVLKPEDFFILSCVRNPWDRMVSFYYHMKVSAPEEFKRRNLFKGLTEDSFEQFVMSEAYRIKRGAYNRFCVKPYLQSQRFSRKADFVIRHENFQQDLEWVAKKFGLGNPKETPSYNTTSRPKGGSYRDYYTSERLISLVAEMFMDTTDEFKYEFTATPQAGNA